MDVKTVVEATPPAVIRVQLLRLPELKEAGRADMLGHARSDFLSPGGISVSETTLFCNSYL